jgi:hypothetical protein
MPSSDLLHPSRLLKKNRCAFNADGILDNEQLLISSHPTFSSLSTEIKSIIITFITQIP